MQTSSQKRTNRLEIWRKLLLMRKSGIKVWRRSLLSSNLIWICWGNEGRDRKRKMKGSRKEKKKMKNLTLLKDLDQINTILCRNLITNLLVHPHKTSNLTLTKKNHQKTQFCRNIRKWNNPSQNRYRIIANNRNKTTRKGSNMKMSNSRIWGKGRGCKLWKGKDRDSSKKDRGNKKEYFWLWSNLNRWWLKTAPKTMHFK